MARKVGSPKAAKKRADTYYSKIVRSVGRCEICGATENLQCAHIFSRRFSNTRCDLQNSVCACAKCHHYMTDHPTEWGRWVLAYMGEPAYEELLKRALVVSPRFDWASKADELRDLYKEMQSEN